MALFRFRLNFTPQKRKFSLSGTRFADSCLPATGNIFAGLMSRRSNASCCAGVGSAANLMLPDSPTETSFRAMVERSVRRAKKAVHGCGARRTLAHRFASGRRRGLDRRGALYPHSLRTALVEQGRGQPIPDAPFGVAGEHAKEHTGADMSFAADEDRLFLQPVGVQHILDCRGLPACSNAFKRKGKDIFEITICVL